MIFVGIDYSLRSPAITVYDSSKGPLTFKNCKFHSRTKKKAPLKNNSYSNVFVVPSTDSECLYTTYHENLEWVKSILSDIPEFCVGLENYGFDSKTGNIQAENCGYMKMWLWSRGIVPKTFAPNTVKKHWAGNGHAKKNQMVDCFIEKMGVDLSDNFGLSTYTDPTNDIVDSTAVCSLLYSMR